MCVCVCVCVCVCACACVCVCVCVCLHLWKAYTSFSRHTTQHRTHISINPFIQPHIHLSQKPKIDCWYRTFWQKIPSLYLKDSLFLIPYPVVFEISVMHRFQDSCVGSLKTSLSTHTPTHTHTHQGVLSSVLYCAPVLDARVRVLVVGEEPRRNVPHRPNVPV